MVLLTKKAWPAIIYYLSIHSLVSFGGESVTRKGQILYQTEQEHTQTPSPQGPSPSEPNSEQSEDEEDGTSGATIP